MNSSDFRSLSEQTTDKGVKSVNYIKKQLEEMEKKEEKGPGETFTAGDSPAEYGRPVLRAGRAGSNSCIVVFGAYR